MAPSTPSIASALEVNYPANAREQEMANMRVHLRLRVTKRGPLPRENELKPKPSTNLMASSQPTSSRLNRNDHEATPIPFDQLRRTWSPCPLRALCNTAPFTAAAFAHAPPRGIDFAE